jgi:predicted nuclease of restriction endonuclease-like (RecB) superfamily
VIDRLAADLKRAFPDMKGFSPRNLKYMRAFAGAWPEEAFVQAVLAQITWYHNLAILEKLASSEDRIWYAKAAIQHGWSRNVLVIRSRAGSTDARERPLPISIRMLIAQAVAEGLVLVTNDEEIRRYGINWTW